MVVMAVVLVILAIIFDTGLMLPAFLFAVLYYIFSINTDREVRILPGKRRADHSCDPGKAAPENSTYADDAGYGSDRTELA